MDSEAAANNRAVVPSPGITNGHRRISYLWTIPRGRAPGANERGRSTKDDECPMHEAVVPSTATIEAEVEKRRRAECMAHMQTYTVQLALDLLVREPDLDGFFRGFI